jgi:septal ring factor EnvC (AmiA/AmiB activator)
MKRILSLTALLATCALGPVIAPAQDAEAEERAKRLRADLDVLQEANVALQKKIAALDTELKRVREEDSRAAGKFATMEDLGRLSRRLDELDRQREADRKLFLEKFEEIRKIVLAGSATPKSTPTPPKAREDSGKGKAKEAATDTGVWHVVKEKQTLTEIIRAYNDDLKEKGKPGKITLAQVLAANEGLDPTRMKVGAKVFIPIPEK